jgi:tRNA(fMet)-specific endonuclease VapC
MTYLFDTDILSIWQTGRGTDYAVLTLRVSEHPLGEIAVSIVTFHEQAIGCHGRLNRAKTSEDLIRGYQLLNRVLNSYTEFPVVSFDAAAVEKHNNLKSLNLRIGEMDVRISAIALAHNLTLVTHNTRDFSKVPNLKLADWTK